MSSALAYPLRLPGWKLAVHLGLSIKTEVLVAFDKNAQKFAARCYDFDRKTRSVPRDRTCPPCKPHWMNNFMLRSKKRFPRSP